MFRRKSAGQTATSDVSLKEGGKGRPTPTRREREAANKAAAKPPRSRRERAAALNAQRAGGSGRTSANGERALLPRDRGPVRAFVRDFVDAHFLVSEILLPMLIVVLVVGFLGIKHLDFVLQLLVVLMLLVAIVNSVFLRFALRRELKARFPDESYQGTTYYAVMRSLQVRFLRMPKPRVKLGEEIPQR